MSDDVIGFTPRYQSGYTIAVPDQGLVATSAWQHWDAMVGGWWSFNHPEVMTEFGGVKSPAASFSGRLLRPGERLAVGQKSGP